MVERSEKLENGSIAVRAWCENVPYVLVAIVVNSAGRSCDETSLLVRSFVRDARWISR